MIADTIGAVLADVLLRGGSIYTFDATRPRATALAIQDGRILALGDDLRELRGPRTRVVELNGRAVVPGFVDSHVHFGSYALSLEQVDLNGAATLQDGLALLGTAAEHLSPESWLRGRGWDRNRWGRLPTAAELDAVIGPRPAALSSHDGHSLWLSSAALQAVGLDHNSQPPPGGVIQRGAHGQPSGVVFETAQELVRARIPAPSHEELARAMAGALKRAAAAGLTGIHNLEDERSLNVFRGLEAAGELTLRVYHGVARTQLRNAEALTLTLSHKERESDALRIGPVKLFADGALGSQTAHLLEPYTGRTDGYRGVATLQPEELVEDMRTAASYGLDVAVHAIGDAAVRAVLDAVQTARNAYPRVNESLIRIEHAQLIHPDDVPRFARLGVIASMQPIHAVADWQAADRHWGARAQYGYAWRDLQRAGALLAFGTDAPVEHLEPLESLYAAITRIDPSGQPRGGWYPDQCLNLTEAVAAYTSGSAAAERASIRRGSLAQGKDADLVVLAPDPFPLPPDALRDTRVELTMVGGRIVYGA
jgi:predicted amidohydrolase YtcJ